MANTSVSNDDLQPLSQAYFELAKKWWWFGITCKLLVFVIGFISILIEIFPTWTVFIIAIIEIASEILLWHSDAVKDTAEELRRKLDARDSFGWQISNAELSDLFIKARDDFRKLAPRETQGEDYFASKKSLGAKKAVENIQESAWWSKHLSERMFKYCLGISLVIFMIALGTLIFCIQAINSRNVLISVGRIVTSTLMLFFTLGLYRRVIGYYEFSHKASKIEATIEALDKQTFSESDAIKIMHEYQLARSNSPLIPSFIWRQMRRKLNLMWTKYRQQQIP